MTYEDPRERTREIKDDPNKTRDRDEEIKTDEKNKDDTYQYTDWASI
ncbi:MAG: hypothetical protein ACU0C9_00685 [Paracoccaceae bacterium]